ncbi:hypothetical protein CHI12_11925 [Terribacillus saccharophilus]|uniref:Uncharacterized protein n=1 Tax=Terribacillus saccharophilus TaxID=361277 RepID=A0A268HBF3_9BACI|nr:hypothetical protein [Terribacillus saccharophilus]PAE07184.1 hypothetical protein CHI12_11925 [Terribacillus saccharophilus]
MEATKARSARKRLIFSLVINLTFATVCIAMLLYMIFIRESGTTNPIQYVTFIILLLNSSIRSIFNILTLRKQSKSLS